jgi:hypothetical protein
MTTTFAVGDRVLLARRIEQPDGSGRFDFTDTPQHPNLHGVVAAVDQTPQHTYYDVRYGPNHTNPNWFAPEWLRAEDY